MIGDKNTEYARKTLNRQSCYCTCAVIITAGIGAFAYVMWRRGYCSSEGKEKDQSLRRNSIGSMEVLSVASRVYSASSQRGVSDMAVDLPVSDGQSSYPLFRRELVNKN